MTSKEKFIKSLRDDVKQKEKQIKYNKQYNTKNLLIKILIRSGYILPVVITSVITFNMLKKINKTPFVIDKVSSYAKVITTDTSIKKTKEEIIYKEGYTYLPTFEYSTGWKLNKNNLFEREIISYRINEFISKDTTEEILSMSKEEINDKFIIINKQKILKNYLEEEDYFYNDDMFIITNMHEDTSKTKIVYEANDVNVVTSCGYIIFLIIIFAINMYNIKKIKIYKKIKDKLDKKYEIVKIEDLSEFEKILRIRKHNLELLEEPKRYTYKIKR